MTPRIESGSCEAGGLQPDLAVQLGACVGRYERALDASLATNGDSPAGLAEQVDMEAEWFADALIEGTKDPAETEGWPWDFADLASRASELLDHVGKSGLCPPLEQRLAPENRERVPGGSQGVQTPPDSRAAAEPGGNPPPRPAGWQFLQDCETSCRTDSHPVLELVFHRFSAKLAGDATDHVRDGPVRMLLLANLIAKAQPSLASLHQLALPCRCFVWGFDLECIILCQNVAEHVPGDGDPESTKAAQRVRLLADRAAKGRLCGPDRALAALRDTLTVLDTSAASPRRQSLTSVAGQRH